MKIRRTVLHAIPAAALVGVLMIGIAPAVKAQDAKTFGKYYGAIRAYELCHDVKFNQTQYEALARAVDQQVPNNLSVGESLAVIDAAQSEADDLVFKYRCDSPQVRDLLALYQSNLETAVR